MNTVTMKNVEFGAGVPKICVPICGKSKEDVLEQAKIILDTPADIIEWRMDWFEQVENTASVVEMAKELREVFKEAPVLATFRSKKEGGEPLIKVGDTVTEGQVIGIVEAMKLMNEIEATSSGIVEEILVENGELVEWNQPLVRLR